MNKNEWKITGIFLGVTALAVLLLALIEDENIMNRLYQTELTIEDLQERNSSTKVIVIDERTVRRKIQERGYNSENVEKFRVEMKKRGFTVQDGKIVRKRGR
jgi:hypothetical protein